MKVWVLYGERTTRRNAGLRARVAMRMVELCETLEHVSFIAGEVRPGSAAWPAFVRKSHQILQKDKEPA